MSNNQAISPQAALERLVTADSISPDWFAPNFLAQVSPLQVQSILTSLATELGTYQRVEPSGSDYQVIYEKGSIPAKIMLNAKGQIAGLLFQSARVSLKSLEDAIAQFKQLPGKVSVLIQENNGNKNTKKIGLNETSPLAVGSAFKLAVLAALKAQIQAGQHRWEDIIAISETQKSLPSGFLHQWAEGSLLTVQSLAALMISQSDNTATDHLIHFVGREAIEQLTPRNRPFLTTREAFTLKAQPNLDVLQQYRAANLANRRALLDKVAQLPLPGVEEFTSDPTAIDIEWFFTPDELCSLMNTVKDLPLMSINPGISDSKGWERVIFKGGSEPGVLNLTTGLQAKDGTQYCVVATWNHDQILDDKRFVSLYESMIDLLK
ncbi:serine hydrolase [Myxacorys almedinensis A]|uniref:Serine hydrolase n=2 Tax=Myxacorys TaxID=2056239 RepID=A0A8J7Z3Y4_9CYAN|nr:serine hydrolase [Myxacorys almedinensis A]